MKTARQILLDYKNHNDYTIDEAEKELLDLFSVSRSKAQEYAAFCVECDRKGMKLLEYDGWVKLN